MSRTTKIIMALLALLILAGGFFAMRLMIASRPEPHKAARENPGALVETLAVTIGERQVLVHGTGTVQPRQQVEIAPQVSGRALEVSPRLVAGGYLRRGEVLFRIEDADFRLAVDRAKAALARAEFELATVQGQARVARQEWQRLKPAEAPDNPLALYEPQLKNAQASLLSAGAALQQAELELERTLVRAPFNGIIRSESVDTGQYLRAGSPVAVFAGTDQAEIVVPLPLHELGWLRIPRAGEAGEGSPATVKLAAGERVYQWSGRIVRSLGDVDPQGRMARVVVAVDDPHGLQGSAQERPPLALGSFVEVILQGQTLENVAVLPSSALRDGEQVWLMNDSHLKFRSVEVVRRARSEVVIGAGLEPGDRVVLTNVAGAAEGMKLRPAAAAGESRP
ncbi:RND transporter [Desulfuromonas versatilis]|uniref:RND transporter n=1 Tax=Desulfuromonas versatilis TaxID=2802975 RepID=A0ABM8HT59_9BACT|nr:efflux RND transporter periplasmic adaptor subunit [Desulfuromonas versatilis]BCR03647.1 RND transporter [Desulfuromonas versatilis]